MILNGAIVGKTADKKTGRRYPAPALQDLG